MTPNDLNFLATNTRRKELVTHLQDEIDAWCEHSDELKIWVFGSFLSDKPEPNDIDILLAYRPKHFTMPPARLPRMHEGTVHVKKNCSSAALKTKSQMVQNFNETEGNVDRGIQLQEADVVELDITRE